MSQYDEATNRLAKVLADQKSVFHRNRSADYVHGYWNAIDDIAAHYGIRVEPKTDFTAGNRTV
jgi:hypothetical protein